MKKSNCILSICVIVGIVVSTITLLVFLDYSTCSLLGEFFCSVFTGCLFAVPSGILIIGEDIKRIRNEQVALLYDLDANFKDITVEDYNNCNFQYIENRRTNIVEIYKLLGRELKENYLKKKKREKMEELLSEVFSFSVITVELSKKYKSITIENFEDDVKHIIALKDSCIKIIEEIQENNFDDIE